MAELQITRNDKKLTVISGTTSAKWCSRLHSNWLSDATSRVYNSLNYNNTMTVPKQQELIEKDAGVPIVYDCIVCLCEVEPEDNGSKKLSNCDHGVQFHEGCIESWLKDHPTCPLCRTHVSRPIGIRLKAYLFKLRDDMVSYCYNALENVATSIGDCDDS